MTVCITKNIFLLAIAPIVFLNIIRAQERGSFIDSRDGRSYKWTKIEGQVWMAENLAFLPKVEHPFKGTLETGKNNMHYYVYGNTSESVDEAKKNKKLSNLWGFI